MRLIDGLAHNHGADTRFKGGTSSDLELCPAHADMRRGAFPTSVGGVLKTRPGNQNDKTASSHYRRVAGKNAHWHRRADGTYSVRTLDSLQLLVIAQPAVQC